MSQTAVVDKKIGGPKKPTETVRNVQIHSYLNPSERERVDQLAARLDLPVASVVRRAILRELALQEAGL